MIGLLIWLVPTLIAFLFTAILLYKKHPMFHSKRELIAMLVLSLVPVINIAAVLGCAFTLFEGKLDAFSSWLDSPVYGSNGKDW